MNAWETLYTVALSLLGVLILLCLLRVIRGPRTADRLMGVNMITTLVIVALCVLSQLLGEAYLTDIALLFSLLGCLAVVVLTRVIAARRAEGAAGEKSPLPARQDRKGGKV